MHKVMKIKLSVLILITLSVLPSCVSKKLNTVSEAITHVVDLKLIEPSASEIPYREIDSDPFHIDDIKVIDDKLRVVVSYGGGCGSVNWQVFYNNLVRKSFPPQTDFLLTLNDEDPCRSIVIDTLHISLGQVESMARAGGVVIRLLPSEDTIHYALPLR